MIFRCKHCDWTYEGDTSHIYVILKHNKRHEPKDDIK